MEQRKRVDEISILLMMHAYSHVLSPDEAYQLFLNMEKKYGIQPNNYHIATLIDVFGRSKRLIEAEQIVNKFPSLISWRTFLGASRLSKDITKAKIAAAEIHKYENRDSSTYVLLSNILGTLGNWTEQISLHNEMKKLGVKKVAGKSWIVIDDKTHFFYAHENKHEDLNKILKMRRICLEEVKKLGYKPDVAWVSKNIPQERKRN
eukprot:TRINITY_DN3272_c0_g1_i3.p1 TRINITY_DN3272_c0_g1~~TRINITY_DN3272_c0_g1_i3.p1  ORF type:complete len:205 (-),score=45.30 TRINITY_DN3272_c0_g1_i3:316-930(-)